NAYGIAGCCRHDQKTYPLGGGLHGGLHALELNSWRAVGGDAFRSGYTSSVPMGITDILPTVLTILGVPVPGHVQGRVLHEALAGNERAALPKVLAQTFSAQGRDEYRAHLTLSYVGETPYLERGWVDSW
ncbi:MAG: hypothetical protein R3268_13575, partial [Acidiferrobacterales bacterium]|nr:hypothetical protein [Acidiferrobacterales bacterium]